MLSSVKRKQIFEIVLMAICTAVLTILELSLSFLPNIQLTFLLIMVYSRVFKTKNALIIIFLHVMIDNLVMGSFNIFFVLVMLIGQSIIPITLNTIFIKVNKPLSLAILSVLYAFIYSWLFIVPSVLILHIDAKAYLLADLPFEGLLACSSFLSVLWLYKPLINIINSFLVKTPNNNKEKLTK